MCLGARNDGFAEPSPEFERTADRPMTDVMNPPTQPPTFEANAASFAPPPAPPAPPAPTTPPPPSSGSAPGDGRKNTRLLTAVVVSALVGAAVSGGIVAVATSNDAATATPSSAVAASSTTAADNPIAALVAQATPSIVSIHDSVVQTDTFGQTAEGQAAGTGFVLTEDGYIVTNNHVVEGATDITVDFSDGSNAAATVVAADPNSDLAVLKVDETGLTPIELGSSSSLQVGDQLVAVGNALDLSGGQTVTTGIVSATGRSLTEPNGVRLVNLIQTDTAINPGQLGRTAAEHVRPGGRDQHRDRRLGRAERRVRDRDRSRQATHRRSAQRRRSAPCPARCVDPAGTGRQRRHRRRVTSGSAADDAGLSKGDVITSIDDATIATPDALATAIAQHQPGDEVKVTYERDGKSATVTVKLGTRDEQN